jgi:hypothetical protein
VVGYRLVNTIETAALDAIHIFCNQHPMEVAGHPIGLFRAIDSSDPKWNFRIAHYGHMLGDLAEETTSIAQGHYRNADRQVTQIEELQALVRRRKKLSQSEMRSLSTGRIRSMRVMP